MRVLVEWGDKRDSPESEIVEAASTVEALTGLFLRLETEGAPLPQYVRAVTMHAMTAAKRTQSCLAYFGGGGEQR